MKKLYLSVCCMIMVCTGFAQKEPKTKNLVIITIDGQRWQETFNGVAKTMSNDTTFVHSSIDKLNAQFWDKDKTKRRALLMPNLWGTIAKVGRIYGNRDKGSLVNVTNPYWISYPGYNEIFTGFGDPLISSNDFPDNPNDNVLAFINKQEGFKNQVAVFATSDAFKRRLNEKKSGLAINVAKGDANVFNAAKNYMQQNHPRVCYITISSTDHFAHEKAYDLYVGAVKRADSIIGQTWKLIQSDPFYKDNTTLLITVDHGRGVGKKWTYHNAKNPGSDQIWFAIAGAGVDAPFGEITGGKQLYQNQFAQTMAALLGLTFTSKDHSIGEKIEDVPIK